MDLTLLQKGGQIMIEFLQQTSNGLVLGSSYVLIALGLTMIFGMLNILNFAHGELLMVGAFVTLGIATGLNIPYLLAIFIAMIVVGVLGIVIERIAFRPLRKSDGINLLVTSLAVSILLQNLMQIIVGPDPQNIVSPFSKINFNLDGVIINGHRLFIFIFSIILISILYFVIQRTKIGIAMRACAFDMETAQLMGIKATTVIVTTFAVGSALAASAGALLAPIFSVYPTMGVMSTMKAFVVVLLGGVGNITGAIVGGLIIGLVETYAAGYISSEYKDVFAFVIMILILLFKPEGLFGKNVQEKV